MSVERSRMIEEELVQYIAENLVTDPEQINLSRRDSGRTVVLKLSVAKNDMGRMIGRSGRVANSIRALLRALPSQEEGRDRRRRRVILEIE
ncbi:MAG: KH domain-containing protein [Chloroflexota bacterium]|nr:KH domain-containing protein [Chloroflexota bacterium]